MIILYKKLAFPSVILSVSISGMNIIAEFQCTLPSYEPICTPPPAYFDWSRCSSQLAFRQSPGNDICGQYFSHYFPFFSPSSTFLIEGVLGLEKVDGSTKKPRGRPHRPFWCPLAAILDFAGVAGGERVTPAPLGWYYKKHLEIVC